MLKNCHSEGAQALLPERPKNLNETTEVEILRSVQSLRMTNS